MRIITYLNLLLLFCIYPYGLFIRACLSKLMLISAIRIHYPDLGPTATGRTVNYVRAIRGPARILIPAFISTKLCYLARCNIHYENVVISRFKSLGPGKSNVIPCWAPG